MKEKSLLRRFSLLLLTCCISLIAVAQKDMNGNVFCDTLQADTLSDIEFPATDCASIHRLKPLEVAIPVAVAGLGAFMVDNGWGEHLRKEAQKGLSAEGRHHTKIDELLQFAPTAAYMGLSFIGVKGRHRFGERFFISCIAAATNVTLTQGLKFICKEERPDGSNDHSFPSGHTARAFQGAEILYQEYKHINPWLAYSGYAIAALTGYLRIYNDKHYINDVVAGAAIGILSSKLAYWLYPKIFTQSRCNRRLRLAALPYYDGSAVGVSMAFGF